jgi:hypothetical protein
MKKITTLLFLSMAAAGFAQADHWTTDALNVADGDNANFGTFNGRSLYFLTGDTARMVLDSLGNLQVKNLSFDQVINNERHLVYVDQHGILSKPVGWVGPITCGQGTDPWVLGGNTLPNISNANIIGPCNNYPFVLQASGKKILTLDTTGYVGLGKDNSSPTTLLDLSDPDIGLGPNNIREHLRFHGDYYGTIEASGEMNLIYNNNFIISQGTYASPTNALKIDGSGNTILYHDVNVNSHFFVSGTTGKTQVGAQTGASNAAMLNVNVAGASGAPVNALDIFDQYTGNVNFRVKSNGYVYSREVNVQLTSFPDYVFSSKYKLKSLDALENYIRENHHLPNVPSAADIQQNGANLGELSKIQMEKIEELTLYVIELKKEIDALKTSNAK